MQVVFPVISGANVNAGVATVGSDIFTVEIDEVDPGGERRGAGTGQPRTASRSTASSTRSPRARSAPNYSACKVVGAGKPPFPFTGPNTFKLSDPAITYTLHLDANNLPQTITASFPVLPSRDLISVGDEIFVISYATHDHGLAAWPGAGGDPHRQFRPSL